MCFDAPSGRRGERMGPAVASVGSATRTNVRFVSHEHVVFAKVAYKGARFLPQPPDWVSRAAAWSVHAAVRRDTAFAVGEIS
jgi:hypothetical protein